MAKKDDSYALPVVKPADLPDCHAEGTNPEGYDVDDKTCHGCPDKFTCLPKSIDNKLVDLTLDYDIEVKSVLSKQMTYSEAVVRMQHRVQLEKDKKPVPDDLSVCPENGLSEKSDPDEPEPEEETESEETQSQQEADKAAEKKEGKEMGTKSKTKPKVRPKPKDDKKEAAKGKPKAPPKAPPKSAAKPPAKPPAKPTKPTKPKKPAKPPTKPKKPTKPVKPKKPAKAKASKPKDRGKPPAGVKKKIWWGPTPRSLTEEQMIKSMEKIKLGVAVDLDFGMQLVRKRRDGGESVVTLTKQGYEVEGELYGSLSAAAWQCANSFRTGNEYFHLVSSACTEIRDKNGKVIARKGME
jgi:hypothetical protein